MFVGLFLLVTIPTALAVFGYQPYQFQRTPYRYNPYASPYGYPQPYRQPYPQPYRYTAQPLPPPTPMPTPLPAPSPYKAAANNMGTLPIGMYDNFVCNKIAGRTRRKRDKKFQKAFGHYLNPVTVSAYNQLLPFVAASEQNLIWQQVHLLAAQRRSPDNIVQTIIANRMYQNGENGNINDIYNAMTHLSNTPDDVVEETQTRAGTAVCTTTNAFYCSYINKLRASAPYCSSAALSNQLYQQCCSAYSTNPLNTAPTPVPSIYSSPTAPAVPSVLSNPINQSNCGISSTNPATRMAEFSEKMNQMRIVGGVNTEKCEYPWMVRLRMGNGMCGGSIIDAYHIVTAAHCVGTNPASTIGVHAGEYDYNNPYETNDQTVKAAAVIKHPNYRDLPNGEQENDIAIIKLAQPLQFNNCVQPICLANDGDGIALPSGTQCTIAGWGTTSSGGQASPILQETTIPTYNGFECSKYFSSTVPSNPNIQLCAGRPVIGGADTCQGDSGGPLFCPINGRYVQYGVVSYGAGCASAGAAGVYTDVGKMRPFIDSVINSGNGK